MRFIRTRQQRSWVQQIQRVGFHAAARLAYTKTAPFKTAWRYFAQLERQGVVEQLTIDAEDYFFDVCDTQVEGEMPLFVAGPNWEAFLTEASIFEQ